MKKQFKVLLTFVFVMLLSLASVYGQAACTTSTSTETATMTDVVYNTATTIVSLGADDAYTATVNVTSIGTQNIYLCESETLSNGSTATLDYSSIAGATVVVTALNFDQTNVESSITIPALGGDVPVAQNGSITSVNYGVVSVDNYSITLPSDNGTGNPAALISFLDNDSVDSVSAAYVNDTGGDWRLLAAGEYNVTGGRVYLLNASIIGNESIWSYVHTTTEGTEWALVSGVINWTVSDYVGNTSTWSYVSTNASAVVPAAQYDVNATAGTVSLDNVSTLFEGETGSICYNKTFTVGVLLVPTKYTVATATYGGTPTLTLDSDELNFTDWTVAYTQTTRTCLARDSCQNTQNTLYAGLALIGLIAIVASAFVIMGLIGGDSGVSMMMIAVAIIGLGIVVMIGYYIFSIVGSSVCVV